MAHLPGFPPLLLLLPPRGRIVERDAFAEPVFPIVYLRVFSLLSGMSNDARHSAFVTLSASPRAPLPARSGPEERAAISGFVSCSVSSILNRYMDDFRKNNSRFSGCDNDTEGNQENSFPL